MSSLLSNASSGVAEGKAQSSWAEPARPSRTSRGADAACELTRGWGGRGRPGGRSSCAHGAKMATGSLTLTLTLIYAKDTSCNRTHDRSHPRPSRGRWRVAGDTHEANPRPLALCQGNHMRSPATTPHPSTRTTTQHKQTLPHTEQQKLDKASREGRGRRRAHEHVAHMASSCHVSWKPHAVTRDRSQPSTRTTTQHKQTLPHSGAAEARQGQSRGEGEKASTRTRGTHGIIIIIIILN
jgi:hypothetical protein